MRKLNFIYILFLVAIISLTALTLWLFLNDRQLASLYTFLLVIAVTVTFVVLINKHFRLFRRMLMSIADEDFSSLGFPKNSFSNHFSREINRAFTQYKKRESLHYEQMLSYEMLLDKTETAFLIVINDSLPNTDPDPKELRVDWMNKSAMMSVGNVARLSALDELCNGFSRAILSNKPSETFVVQFSRNEVQYEMAVSTVLLNDKIVVTLQNIHSVLEASELIAWQRLISVLTHEIMNSLAPIISLSDTLMERVQDESQRQALATIRRRSEGLRTFVENYRRITRVPLPSKTVFPVEALFEDIRSYFAEGTVSFRLRSDQIRLNADRSQMEQILINLVRNAIEADSPQPIVLEAYTHPLTANVIISVTDHGNGIAPEVLEKIFVPFFSTKPSGSGIGLSLCKQIISLHGGSITARWEETAGTTFTISLPGTIRG